MKTYKTEFQLSSSDLETFSRVTRDSNPLHLDPEFARKTRFRRCVVHGMLPFLFLSRIQNEFPDEAIFFSKIKGSFKEPLFIGDSVELIVNYEATGDPDVYSFDANWRSIQSESISTKVTGQFRLVDKYKGQLTESGDCFYQNECQLSDDEISSEYSEENEVSLNTNGIRSLESIVQCDLNREVLISSLLTTIVGMRKPGKNSLFLGFDLKFKAPAKVSGFNLNHSLSKHYPATNRVKLSVEFSDGGNIICSGSVSAQKMMVKESKMAMNEISKKYGTLNLNEKRVLIIGASRGIGAATAQLFSLLGAEVGVHYFRGKEEATLLVDEINASGGKALLVNGDVREKSDCEKILSQFTESDSKIDVLINCAVGQFSPRDFASTKWSDFENEIDISLKGAFYLSKSIIPIMKECGGGKIIHLSTVLVDSPISGQSSYITLKSAIEGFSNALSKEVQADNIKVNIVAPSMTETSLISSLGETVLKKYTEERPNKSILKPYDVAQTLAFLSSSWGDHFSGQKIVMDLN